MARRGSIDRHGRLFTPRPSIVSAASTPDGLTLDEVVARRNQRKARLVVLEQRLTKLLAMEEQLRQLQGRTPEAFVREEKRSLSIDAKKHSDCALASRQTGLPGGAHYHNEMVIGYGPLSVDRQVRLFVNDDGSKMDFWIHSTHWWCVPDVPFTVSKSAEPGNLKKLTFDKKLMEGMKGTVVTAIRAWYDADRDVCPIEVVVWTSWVSPDMVVPAELQRKVSPNDGWAGENAEIVGGSASAPPRTIRALP
eukprot:TRINITY_DN2810_c3_g1_i1.p1 TRINITY_DN2810_c3_g1~~TRINITY_DN2810_c3_g1_i1.p1  ORF type:complete len:266 (+),score=17.22 TRINITY_DN2810_c3_g1_i1:51-800(+)